MFVSIVSHLRSRAASIIAAGVRIGFAFYWVSEPGSRQVEIGPYKRSGSASKRKVGSGSHQNGKSDPDRHQNDEDKPH